MIRPATLIWSLLALVSGVGLFLLKHDVQRLEEAHARLIRAIAEGREAIHVLKAEWSYLNEFDRLQALADRHLELTPMSGARWGRLEDLPRRDSPAAGEPAPTPARRPRP
ncbi:MAG: hypothetical protein HY521_12240 [Proteobacteria bacterium]|nr:hypothetical protein [Pseudomonadota bacterium]